MSATLTPSSPTPAPNSPEIGAGGVRLQTAREWLHELGDVPLERILFDPPPGAATESDVIRLEDHADRICELVDGTLVEKTMGQFESIIAARLIYLLSLIVIPKGSGS